MSLLFCEVRWVALQDSEVQASVVANGDSNEHSRPRLGRTFCDTIDENAIEMQFSPIIQHNGHGGVRGATA